MEIRASCGLSTVLFYTTEETHRYGTKCKYNCELMDLVVLSFYDLLFAIFKKKNAQ